MSNVDWAGLIGNVSTRRGEQNDLNRSSHDRSSDVNRRHRRLQEVIEEALEIVADIDFDDDAETGAGAEAEQGEGEESS